MVDDDFISHIVILLNHHRRTCRLAINPRRMDNKYYIDSRDGGEKKTA